MADIYQQLTGVAPLEQARVTDSGAPGGGGSGGSDLSTHIWEQMRTTHSEQAATASPLVCTPDDAVGGRLDEAIENGESLLPPLEFIENKSESDNLDKGEAKGVQKPLDSNGKLSTGVEKE